MTARAAMKQRAAVGTRWRRRRDNTEWTVRQSHRKDQMAELEAIAMELNGVKVRRFVPFDTLRRYYEEVT